RSVCADRIRPSSLIENIVDNPKVFHDLLYIRRGWPIAIYTEVDRCSIWLTNFGLGILHRVLSVLTSPLFVQISQYIVVILIDDSDRKASSQERVQFSAVQYLGWHFWLLLKCVVAKHSFHAA